MSDLITANRFNLNDSIIRQADRINTATKKQDAANTKLNGSSFQELLNQQLHPAVSFSKHANMRTEERNIQITQNDLNRLGDACDKAQEKGIKDALIVMDDSAFIVNAPNKVVITVVDKNELKSNVFTNIDGAVFL